MRRTVVGLKRKATEWRRAERWGLRWNACDTRRTFSGVRTVWGQPEGFLLTMDAVVLNCVTQFNIVWRVGTFPFLPMSKCRRKTCCVTVVEPLFLKNVSTANARCSTDQRCMMTEGFKPLSPAMHVSLHHLHRCRHGAKFKSSNGFCPTVAEPLFLKNVSTANARCWTNQRCMMTEGFKPLYPAMCVSLRHLHRCRHGAKFKLSNGFCPTLYLCLNIRLNQSVITIL